MRWWFWLGRAVRENSFETQFGIDKVGCQICFFPMFAGLSSESRLFCIEPWMCVASFSFFLFFYLGGGILLVSNRLYKSFAPKCEAPSNNKIWKFEIQKPDECVFKQMTIRTGMAMPNSNTKNVQNITKVNTLEVETKHVNMNTKK